MMEITNFQISVIWPLEVQATWFCVFFTFLVFVYPLVVIRCPFEDVLPLYPLLYRLF